MRIRDGDSSDPGRKKVGSGINISDPQHCLKPSWTAVEFIDPWLGDKVKLRHRDVVATRQATWLAARYNPMPELTSIPVRDLWIRLLFSYRGCEFRPIVQYTVMENALIYNQYKSFRHINCSGKFLFPTLNNKNVMKWTSKPVLGTGIMLMYLFMLRGT